MHGVAEECTRWVADKASTNVDSLTHRPRGNDRHESI